MLARAATRRIVPLLALLGASSTFSAPARAQGFAGWRFQVDNDYFDFWLPSRRRPDHNYTHGATLRAAYDAAPSWARGGNMECSAPHTDTLPARKCARTFVTIAQEIYNPTDDSPFPVPGERPYAGLLYAEIGRQMLDARKASDFAIRFGTTGQASGAGGAQTLFHKLTDQRRPQGWEHQVAEETVFGATYARQYLLTSRRAAGSSPMVLVARGGATATTVQTGLSAGLEMRAGYRVPHPWMPKQDTRHKRFSAYLLLGGTDDWVLHDALIEGNSPATTGLVKKKPFVFRGVWGFAVGLGDFFVEYRAVSQSRDYDSAPEWHRWGAISLILGRP
jgi:lipid A 3-O-deacylase